METEFECPVCRARDWRTIGSVEIGRDDPLPPGPTGDYVGLRRRILFEAWLPGESAVRLTGQYCGDCGFACYSPRPTAGDVEAKYRAMQALAPGSGGGKALDDRARRWDEARARRVFAAVRGHAGGRGPLRVLDFGGEDGKLLGPFVDAGHDCELVDYARRVRPGVRKVGDTLADVPAERRYDVIVCSHVLEHVADPGATVAQLASRLTAEGVIYGEVPLEMWRGMAALRWDPVTHINFFTVGSFARLFAARGLSVLEAREAAGTYDRERLEAVIVIAGASPAPRGFVSPDGVACTLRRLRPRPMGVVRRSLRLHQWPARGEVVDAVRQTVPPGLRRRVRAALSGSPAAARPGD